MSLIDDTCDNCGRRFDPMGDPLLTRHPEVGPWAVFCKTCEDKSFVPTSAQIAAAKVRVKADKILGVETPAKIRNIAEYGNE